MKIIICGSVKLSGKMLKIKEELVELGHAVVLPRHTEEYAQMGRDDHIHNESYKNKLNNDLIRDYYEKIKQSDAVLVVNEDLNDIKNYIGGNSFLEMGFAHVLNKKIFLLNQIPEMIYTDEIKAMQPICLKGSISAVK
jgi:nucleoside 2-deoxyribosyltransferase